MVYEIPLLMKMAQHLPEEVYCVLFGYFQQEIRYSCAEIVLVNHFIEIPEAKEEGLNDIR